MCDGCPTCVACNKRQRVGAFRVGGVVAASRVGLTRADLATRVERLAGAVERAGINDPSWRAWLHAWRRSKTPDLTSAAEVLARYAERLGGAMSGQVQVSGRGTSWSWGGIGEGFNRLFSGQPQRQPAPVARESQTLTPGLIQKPSADVLAVEGALGSVIHAIAPIVPYGKQIEQAHDARMRLMYGQQSPAAPQRGPVATPLPAKVRDAQATTRAARRGEPAARQRIATTMARTDATGRKEAAILGATRRADSRKIDALYRSRGGN